MRIIAFKIANCVTSRVIDSLPENWITEYTFVDLQLENSLLESEGWQFLPEDEFNILLTDSNSNEKLEEYKTKNREQQLVALEAWKIKSAELEATKAAETAELEAFKIWKASQNG